MSINDGCAPETINPSSFYGSPWTVWRVRHQHCSGTVHGQELADSDPGSTPSTHLRQLAVLAPHTSLQRLHAVSTPPGAPPGSALGPPRCRGNLGLPGNLGISPWASG